MQESLNLPTRILDQPRDSAQLSSASSICLGAMADAPSSVKEEPKVGVKGEAEVKTEVKEACQQPMV